MTTIKVLLFISCIFPTAHAEVITDGSLGTKIELSGKNFQITPELGQQLGGNLFHSFQSFNLNSDESATFSGTDSVQNIISRVTGGSPSHLDGLIRSTLPNADLYFINPYGVMFGPNAKLDLQGGFHVSTADYLKLQDGGRFEARNPSNSLLSVAPITAFGFLETPSSIQIQDSQLTVAPHTELSLVGGDLTLNHAKFTADSGQINLVSVASIGEVLARKIQTPDTSSFSQLGLIKITNTQLEASGLPSGGISVRGGQLQMFDSRIRAHNIGSDTGKGVDIELRESVLLKGNTVEKESFGITSDTSGAGNAGHIAITTPRLDMQQNTLDVSTQGEGLGGNIDIQTQQLFLGEGAEILSNVFSTGAGGQIHIKATERMELVDQRVFATVEDVSQNRRTLIQTNNFGSGNGSNISIDTPHLKMYGGNILSNINAQGQGGSLMINSQFMELLNGSVISAGVLPYATGNSGGIKLNISDTLKLSGIRLGFIGDSSIMIQNMQSSIGAATLGNGKGGLLEIAAKNLIITDYAGIGPVTVGNGDAGDLMINVDNLYLRNGGILTNGSGTIIGEMLVPATGKGGHLTVIAKEDIVIEGRNPFYSSSIATNTFHSGQGGNIDLQANRLIVREGGTVTANSLGSGNAGDIHIKVGEIHLSSGGEITSAAMQAIGGNIGISAGTLIYLQNSQITTSVSGGAGNGGNIIIDNPQFIVLNHAQIKAQADIGHGGNIHIGAQHFVPSFDSLISASSNLGIDGQILIQSPTEDVGNQVLNLSANFLNAAALLPLSCAARIADQRPSEFMRPFTLVLKPHILNDAPEDIHTSQLANHN